MTDISGAIEGLGYASESWAGWRFIISRKYRETVIESWKKKSASRIGFEIFAGIFYIAFSLIFVIWVLGQVCASS